MQDYRDFTVDQSAEGFKGLPEFVDELHEMNMRFVPIIDAGISYRPSSDYSAVVDGIAKGVFLMLDKAVFVGEVWPNEAVFPDFYKPETSAWWAEQLDKFSALIKFDGLW